jgi:hypothetical protein
VVVVRLRRRLGAAAEAEQGGHGHPHLAHLGFVGGVRVVCGGGGLPPACACACACDCALVPSRSR